MKTKLCFEAPSDLSVGSVRITNQAGEVANWIATPDHRRFIDEDANPGFYAAEISPIGVAPQSVIFEVKKGVVNTVSTPPFAALSVTGSGTTFLNVTDKESAIEELYRIKKGPLQDISDQLPQKVLIETPPISTTITGQEKCLSIGLSQEVGGKGKSWRPLKPSLVQISLELAGGQLNLEVKGQPEWSPSSGKRVRLSLAIEGVRIERLLLPMYQGGTTIELTPSSLSASDVELQVIPSDPKLRALLRALQAGTSDDAKAVRDYVLEGHNLAVMFGKEVGDPWGAILSWLLFIRFPEVFGKFPPSLTEHLIELAPWAYDTYVILARQQLLYTSGSSPEDQIHAAEAALDQLVMAQEQGSPYYSYTSHLFCEMIEALCAFQGLSPHAFERAHKTRQRWRRDYPLQSSAGASFSWLYYVLKEGVLAPCRPTSDLLYDRHSTIVVKGRIESGLISIDASSRNEPKSDEKGWQESLAAKMNLMEAAQELSPEMSPAMSRPAGPPSDPNKGRFGGKDTWKGFALNARFRPTDSRKWVTITLVVEADSSIHLGHGDVVWFCLHPTFQPQWIKVMFRGRRAMLSVQAWGGFTVGAWLPTQEVELECDLAELPDAPRVIREL